MTCQLKAIGKVKNDGNGTFIQLGRSTFPDCRPWKASAISMSFGGSVIATTTQTGMNYRQNSPIKAHPKLWGYLRHALLCVRTLLH